MIITLDGPAGSGKSSLAKRIANFFKIPYLDTGAMYRALTWYLIEKKIDPRDLAKIQEILNHFDLSFEEERVFVGDRDISKEIRSPLIDKKVSQIAAISMVRSAMKKLQQKIVSDHFVVEGRDMGSVVFPHADYKFYIDASCEERAKRRYQQIKQRGEDPPPYENILDNIKKRDFEDQNRSVSPLIVPKDAVLIQTDSLSLEEVFRKILSYLPSVN